MGCACMADTKLKRLDLFGDVIPKGTTTSYSATPVDLRHISWDFKSEHSTDGVAPKAFYDGKFYKLSAYNRDCGFYGDEAVTECVVSDVLDTMSVEHLKYSLLMGLITYDGREYITPVCVSLDFNPSGRPIISLERYLRSHYPNMGHLDACIRLGFSEYIYTMFAVDFLIINRDRHGANIELMDGRPLPLFDHGASLVALNDIGRWDHWSADKVNNYIGSYSLRQNLESIPRDSWPKIEAPAVSVVDRVSGFWSRDKISFVKRMLLERWGVIEHRRDGVS